MITMTCLRCVIVRTAPECFGVSVGTLLRASGPKLADTHQRHRFSVHNDMTADLLARFPVDHT